MKQILLTGEQYLALKERVSELIPEDGPDVLISGLEANYLTNRDLMSILKISRRTAARWRDTGHLPYIKIEHKLFYPTRDILNHFRVMPATPSPYGHSPPEPGGLTGDEIPEMQCEKCPLFLLMNS